MWDTALTNTIGFLLREEGVAMADANLILAVARGLRPALISGVVANARAEVNQLVQSDQLADRRTMIALAAANSLQSPIGIDILA